MLKRMVTIVGVGIFGLCVLFFVAGRPISELFGYFRAGASTTVKTIENEIPDVVHDEKTDTELVTAREQLIDRQVQLNLSQNQLKNLEHEISTLQEAVSDRSQVLASAYPVLQNAIDDQQQEISFVSTDFSLEEFQHEIDDLLSMQERDENALRIKMAGYERLNQSVADGEAALAAMKKEMLENEQDFAILKTRRDQARMEAETLDLVAGATSSGKSSTASIGKSIDRLQGQVEQLEARNAARRDVASVSEGAATGRVAQSFNRLEALKKYAETAELNSESNDEGGNLTSDEKSGQPLSSAKATPFDATEVVIHITGEKTTRDE